MRSSRCWGMILAIVLVVLGGSVAYAASPCCADSEGFQCRKAENAFDLVLGQGGTGCWEGAGVCIGGSPLQSCFCVGEACFARYWGDSPRSIEPVYVPVSPGDCTRAARKGCCSTNHTPGPNCTPVAHGRNR